MRFCCKIMGMGESMTLSRSLFSTLFLLMTLATPGYAAERSETLRNTPQRLKEKATKEQKAATDKAAAQATQKVNEDYRAGKFQPGSTGVTPLGLGAVDTPKDTPKKPVEGHNVPVWKGRKAGGRPPSSFADNVLKDPVFSEKMAEKLVRGPDGKKVTGIDPKVKANGEKIDGMKLTDNYAKLKGAFNENTMKDYAKKIGEIRKALGSSKLTAAEKVTLETAILVFLKEVEKDPKAAADALKQLDDLMKDFADELADADPKMREMGLKYILGTLAYYSKVGQDGKVQLSIAKDLWNSTQGTAREGMAEMMEARANLHSDFIAQQVAKGKGAGEIDYAAAWKHVEDGTVDWVLHRLVENGEDLNNLPETVRDILCKCSKHASACKV